MKTLAKIVGMASLSGLGFFNPVFSQDDGFVNNQKTYYLEDGRKVTVTRYGKKTVNGKTGYNYHYEYEDKPTEQSKQNTYQHSQGSNSQTQQSNSSYNYGSTPARIIERATGGSGTSGGGSTNTENIVTGALLIGGGLLLLNQLLKPKEQSYEYNENPPQEEYQTPTPEENSAPVKEENFFGNDSKEENFFGNDSKEENFFGNDSKEENFFEEGSNEDSGNWLEEKSQEFDFGDKQKSYFDSFSRDVDWCYQRNFPTDKARDDCIKNVSTSLADQFKIDADYCYKWNSNNPKGIKGCLENMEKNDSKWFMEMYEKVWDVGVYEGMKKKLGPFGKPFMNGAKDLDELYTGKITMKEWMSEQSQEFLDKFMDASVKKEGDSDN